MHVVTVRGLKIGEGIPKICVPMVGTTQEEILQEAQKVKNLSADLVEWRVDWFAQAYDIQAVEHMLARLREALGETPLLVTFRTKAEGGEKPIELKTYIALYEMVAQSQMADLIDVQLFLGDAVVKPLMQTVHRYGVKVVASNHDFSKTPPKQEIIERLCRMQELDADILKIAVMPRSRADVLTLLAATEEMCTEHADRPVVTMSMGGDGVISRLCGEAVGSAITFGAAKKASAPGQMQVEELKHVLMLIHNAMCK